MTRAAILTAMLLAATAFGGDYAADHAVNKQFSLVYPVYVYTNSYTPDDNDAYKQLDIDQPSDVKPVAHGNYRRYVKTVCEWPRCDATERLEVHHIIPKDALDELRMPELLDDPRNLITLCRRCHVTYGHLGDTSRWNVHLLDMMEAAR